MIERIEIQPKSAASKELGLQLKSRLLIRVIRAAHERAGFDVAKAERNSGPKSKPWNVQQSAFPMKDQNDLYLPQFWPQPINNAIVAVQQLTQVTHLELGHDSAKNGTMTQYFDATQNFMAKVFCGNGFVRSDIVDDLPQ